MQVTVEADICTREKRTSHVFCRLLAAVYAGRPTVVRVGTGRYIWVSR